MGDIGKISAGLACGLVLASSSAHAASQAKTPPMGWNPWNAFRTEVTEDKIMGVAHALVTSGLADAGYRYVNMDDGWWLKREASGRIVVRTSMFPSAAPTTPGGETSLRPYTDKLHALGLKAGLYTDIGHNACSQAWDRTSPNLPQGSVAEREIGSLDHQKEDMKLFFGEWGFDYLKVDACGMADFTPDKDQVKDGTYRAFGPWIVREHPDPVNDAKVEALYTSLDDAIAAVRPKGDYVLSLCTWGEASVIDWGNKRGTIWRISEDIDPKWSTMLRNFDAAAAHPEKAGPGHWNDPDMLEIGNGEFDGDHLTEARAHMSMWAIISAPLLIGSDVTKWPQSLIDVAGNREVIAIDQDPLGLQGVVVSHDGDGEVVVKKLAKGKAVALINRGTGTLSVSVSREQLGLGKGKVTARDLWSHKATNVKAGITVTLAPHETALYRLTGG